MEEQRGPGRPRVREVVLEVGLSKDAASAHRWLMRRWGLTSKTACVNEALVQHAIRLGWKPPARKAGG